MKRHNAEDEDERQDQHDNGVDLEAGRLVRVETEHCAAGTTGAGGARAAGADIGDLLLLVGGGPSADGSPGASGDRGRGRASSRRTGRGGGVWGGGTGRRLSGNQVSHGGRGRMALVQPCFVATRLGGRDGAIWHRPSKLRGQFRIRTILKGIKSGWKIK